jgi:hypothetical protein
MSLLNVSKSVKDQLKENYQGGPSTWPKELAILFDDTIEARPLNLPGIGQIKIKNTEMCYHWVRRPMGPNPDLTRYMQLKTAGFRNATLEDVDALVSSVNADETEITCGQDLILMKAPPELYYGAIKAHAKRAMDMTNPRSSVAQAQMRSANYGDQATLNATRTELLDDTRMADFESRANAGNAVKQGDPQWDAILEGSKKKGAK